MKIIAKNKKAYFDYFIEEEYECGISLTGAEVKSIRAGKVNLKDSFASIVGGEIYIKNMHISPYEHVSFDAPSPTRDRKLLMHKQEIVKLHSKVAEKGYTVVPLSLYWKESLIKVELGLAKGKNLYDKRATEREKTIKREIEQSFRQNNGTDR